MVIHEIVEEIESICDGDGWSISLDFLLATLDCSHEDYYRWLYSCRQRESDRRRNGSAAMATASFEQFTPKNGEQLIAFLDYCGIEDAEEELIRAGLWLSEAQRQRWQEAFLSITLSRLLDHKVDHELLEISLAGCTNPTDGLEFYTSSLFPFDELIERSLRIYLDQSGIESTLWVRNELQYHIKDQIRRRQIQPEEIFAALHGALRRYAEQHGWITRSRFGDSADDRNAGKRHAEAGDSEVAEALRLLKLPIGSHPSRRELQLAYYEQIKLYHPDRNADGEERSRQINRAYSLLLSRLFSAKGRDH